MAAAKAAKKPETKKTKKAKKVKNKKRRFILSAILLCFLIISTGLAIFLYVRYGSDIIEAKRQAAELVQNSTEDTFRASETSIVYAANGKQIATLKGDKNMYYVEMSSIPQYAVNAMIVTEDRKFMKHNGIDIKAIAAAAVSLIKNNGEIKRGGSTITQQLARNVFLNNAVEFSRKIKEIFIALELEKKYDKDQIMEFYLNNIYFANGYYGLETASRGYFSKSCAELSLAQVAFLCAIPNSPTRYDPVVNYDNTNERKNRILDQMLSEKKITQDEYNIAYNEEIKLDRPEVKKRNYIETYVTNCATKALMEMYGFEFRYEKDISKDSEYDANYNDMYSQCQQMLYRSGFRIYTSIDMQMQKQLQKAVNEGLSEDKRKTDDGIYKFQGAGVCIDNDSGKVTAVVGGRSQSQITGYTFNRAYQSFRQPGSAIKPIAVYAPAFDNGYGPSDVIRDEPIKDGPKNSNGRYMGNVSLRTAIEYSTNTVAWKVFEELSPKRCLEYLLNMEFSKIVSDDYTLASSLGGLTNGVSPVEMASAYATLENKGVFREPTCIVSITDSEGNEILTDEIFEEKRIYEEETAQSMTDVLCGVLQRGTAKGYALENMASAGKTGTTNEHKDGWFAGYTPYYTTVIWVGCDTPESIDGLLGNTYPLYIWKSYMTQIHEDLPEAEFDMGDDDDDDKEPVARTQAPTKEPEEDDEPDDFYDEEPEETAEPTPEQVITPQPQEPTEAPVETQPPATQTPEPTKEAAPTKQPDAPTQTPVDEGSEYDETTQQEPL